MTHHRYWPLFDLRLQTADLLLRPMTEDDQFRLAESLPRTSNSTRTRPATRAWPSRSAEA